MNKKRYLLASFFFLLILAFCLPMTCSAASYRCKLGGKNGRNYYLTEPTDVQYNYENKSCSKAYRALSKVIIEIPKRFKLK